MGGTQSPWGAKDRTSTQNTWYRGKWNGEHAWPSRVGKKMGELKVEGEERVSQKEEVGKTAL